MEAWDEFLEYYLSSELVLRFHYTQITGWRVWYHPQQHCTTLLSVYAQPSQAFLPVEYAEPHDASDNQQPRRLFTRSGVEHLSRAQHVTQHIIPLILRLILLLQGKREFVQELGKTQSNKNSQSMKTSQLGRSSSKTRKLASCLNLKPCLSYCGP